MSYKTQVFSGDGLLPPQTVDRFYLYIPWLFTAPLRAYSATYPGQTFLFQEIVFKGRKISIPYAQDTTGEWKVSVYEDSTSEVAQQIQILERSVMNVDKEGDVKTSLKSVIGNDILIFITDQYTGLVPLYWSTLKQCVVRSVEPVQLSWEGPQKPLSWSINFKYHGIVRNYLDVKRVLPL